MGMNKPRFHDDQFGIAPLIAGVILLLVIGGIVVAGVGVYQFTMKPNVTYNITDTGFSLAGLGIDSTWLIVGIIAGLIVLFLMFRKK